MRQLSLFLVVLFTISSDLFSQDAELTAALAIRYARDILVAVVCRTDAGRITEVSSGVVVSKHEVLTVAHAACEGGGEHLLVARGEEIFIDATVLARDLQADLMLLRVVTPLRHPVRLDMRVSPGDQVLILGYALPGLALIHGSVVGWWDAIMLMLDAHGLPGLSGSAVVRIRDRTMIGIASRIVIPTDNPAFGPFMLACSSARINRFMREQLR